jgi:hypothetical protein
MPPSLPPLVDALQAGALLSLGAYFAADALARRDQAMGWIAAVCWIIAFRHAALILGASGVIPADAADKTQSLMVALGFVLILKAFSLIFGPHMPRYAVAAAGVGVVPVLVAVFFLLPGNPLIPVLRNATLAAYALGMVLTLVSAFRSYRAKDPVSGRILLGLAVVAIPVFVEISALGFYGIRIQVSGISVLLVAFFVGASWYWVITERLQDRVERTELESSAWRSLVPGPSWRTDEPSPLMERLFGKGWEQDRNERRVGSDGVLYIFHRATFGPDDVGYVEVASDAQPGSEQFLSGWTVALGIEEGPEGREITRKLESWGAQVQAWGTVPPREGPYPSLLIWAREPSILSVWREDDLHRRRCRWVQLGGVPTEGPHARLERPLQEHALVETLRGMLSLRGPTPRSAG